MHINAIRCCPARISPADSSHPGNYYGTPRPVHISAESPPITYQEHRNLLRNFRTRSKSLSNLEKAAEDGENSEEDSGLSGKYDGKVMSMKENREVISW
ncbi:hypothetical protein D9C73_010792 [Collichthys lucidus]|uniref:Uncharacterized protein n=1 Tax=Collichthys lucidus TaxID=240159 RepID=A0A4V6XYN9_COLLU|nr:hypothetical protein D9C73_010792 [Collichthys lucidus]